MNENKRNIAIGLTVITGLAMLCGLIVLFAGLPQIFTTGYTVRMHFWQTHDIRAGDPIYLRGKRVGRVTEVGFTDGDARNGVTIVAKVDSTLHIPRNIQARVFTRGLVGKGYLTLVPPAQTDEQAKFYTIDEVINLQGKHNKGTGLLPKELTDSLKNFGKLAKNLNELIAPAPKGQPATSQPGSPQLPTGLRGTVARMNRTLDALYAITGDDQNQANLKATLANLAKASQKADEAMAALKETASRAQKTLGGADELTRKLITSAEDISTLLKSISVMVEKINHGNGTAGKLLNDPALYNNLVQVGEQMNELVKDFRRLARQWKEKGVDLRLK
jgi:phospholipid/cholesterol/gamma-HCH transport system substrate-binding protein